MQESNQVNNSIRVFENRFLESLTHVHPITPLIVWTPVVFYFFYASTLDQLSVAQVIASAFIGILVWTLLEYVVHRFLFHFPAQSALSKRLVFLFHGLHHDAPNDKTRLVFPPVPAIGIMSLLYALFTVFIPPVMMNAFMGGFIVGYLCYDYIHYATHHFPMTSKAGRYLRKYHLQHHFSHENSKYGVSSPLWDYIFRTVSTKKN